MSFIAIIIFGLLALFGISYWSIRKTKAHANDYYQHKLSALEFQQKFSKFIFSGGTFQFYGNWFGRPMDNFHELNDVEYNQTKDVLKLIFSEKEVITIWKPSQILIGDKELCIKNAYKIELEWFLFGEQPIAENLRFQTYQDNGININFSTNFQSKNSKVHCTRNKPALSIFS